MARGINFFPHPGSREGSDVLGGKKISPLVSSPQQWSRRHVCQGDASRPVGTGKCSHSNKTPLSTEETKRAPINVTNHGGVGPQKLPSSRNESPIENVKEGSFCPFRGSGGSQLETNARNRLEPCNCQGRGRLSAQLPRAGGCLSQGCRARHGTARITARRVDLAGRALRSAGLHSLIQASAPGCLAAALPDPPRHPFPCFLFLGTYHAI